MTYAQQLSYKRLIRAKATKLGSGLEWLYVLMRMTEIFKTLLSRDRSLMVATFSMVEILPEQFKFKL